MINISFGPMYKHIIALIFILFCLIGLNGQDRPIQDISNKLFKQHQKAWKLDKSDIENVQILSHYESRVSGVIHIYVNQTIDNIPIYNAVSNFSISKNGQLINANNGFISNAKKRIKRKKDKTTVREAIALYAKHHNLNPPEVLKAHKSSDSTNEYKFDKVGIYNEGISVRQVYLKVEDVLLLAWEVDARVKSGQDYWTSFFDVNTGHHLHSRDNVKRCTIHKHHYKNFDRACREFNTKQSNIFVQEGVDDGSEYKVYALPLENPLDGEQSTLKNPASELASPFGWHDTDGIDGPEHTITRGNNVHAFSNSSGNGSQGDEPDGGESLSFLFDHDRLKEPQQNIDSDITQLFYVNNWMHDFSYFFGFDEAAGNFQVNNYGNPGRGNDYVEARGLEFQQDNGSQVFNNARFSNGSDGSKGIMFMFPWTFSDITVTMVAPSNEIFEFTHSGSSFGLPTQSEMIAKPIVQAEDVGDALLTNACDSITNGDDINGNIAIVDRGECDFSFKVFQLQELGALAVVVCNRDEQLVTMAAGEQSEFVTIPSAFMRRSDCDRLLATVNAGKEVILNFDVDVPSPAVVSGSFDSGITTHEYTHGISQRLTGGRSQSSCLSNLEEMGEGWSDFLGLVATHQAGDLGTDARGIGIYADRTTPGERGIRRYPYSTDMTINPQTYNDIRFTGFGGIESEGRRRGEHEVGEVWASMLWDMYWKFIDEYGFDLNWTNRESGNSKAIQLVFEGMAIQKCNPGFIDGRKAILSADEALHNGENQCLIWDVFARRGLGFDADQGLSSDREDGVEGFLSAPTCRDELTINKDATEIIDAGDNIDITISIGNFTGQDLTGVTITDAVPVGTTPDLDLLPSNARYNDAENTITFDIGAMSQLEEQTLQYQLITDPDQASTPIYFDDFEQEQTMIPTSLLGSTNWSNKIDTDGNIWNIEASIGVFDQTIETAQSIDLSNFIQPVVSFRHSYETELFFAGGDIEISTNGGNEWVSIESDKFIINAYNDAVIYKSAGLKGFTGSSDGFVISTIDLSEYINQSVDIRFRYTSILDGGKADLSTPRIGWTISNIEFFDLNQHNGIEACINSNEGFLACDRANTLIKADEGSSVNDENIVQYNFSVTPNPGHDFIYVNMESNDLTEGILKLLTLDGRIITITQIRFNNAQQSIRVNTNDVPSGFYFIEFTSDNLRISDKVIINH